MTWRTASGPAISMTFRGDADSVLGTAGAFAQAGYPYQLTRTLALAAVPPSAPK